MRKGRKWEKERQREERGLGGERGSFAPRSVMRKFEISRASPAVSSVATPLRLPQHPAPKKNITAPVVINGWSAYFHSLASSSLVALFLCHLVEDYKGAWYKALSLFLFLFPLLSYSLFVCPSSFLSTHNARDRARGFRGQPRLHTRRRDATTIGATRDRPATYRSTVTLTYPNICR